MQTKNSNSSPNSFLRIFVPENCGPEETMTSRECFRSIFKRIEKKDIRRNKAEFQEGNGEKVWEGRVSWNPFRNLFPFLPDDSYGPCTYVSTEGSIYNYTTDTGL